jgi:hypothetical protein
VLHCLGIRSDGATPATVQSTKLDLSFENKTGGFVAHENGNCNDIPTPLDFSYVRDTVSRAKLQSNLAMFDAQRDIAFAVVRRWQNV